MRWRKGEWKNRKLKMVGPLAKPPLHDLTILSFTPHLLPDSLSLGRIGQDSDGKRWWVKETRAMNRDNAP
jgi:hypothetical protein